MADFNRAMSQLLSVFTKELGGKVTVKEIEAMPRIGFLAIPGKEYSDRLVREFFPRRETREIMRATAFLKSIVEERKSPAPKPSGKFSLSEFTSAMSECLKIFTEELGGRATMAELGSNARLKMFTMTGVEQSDMLYKEFYPGRETAELQRTAVVLKGIVAKRKGGGMTGYGKLPKRREPQTVYTPYTPSKLDPGMAAPDYSNFYSPAKPLVKKAVLDTMKDPAAATAPHYSNYTNPAAPLVKNAILDTMEPTGFTGTPAGRGLVFDYQSFTMKPISTWI